jgi:hypothetical protein
MNGGVTKAQSRVAPVRAAMEAAICRRAREPEAATRVAIRPVEVGDDPAALVGDEGGGVIS